LTESQAFSIGSLTWPFNNFSVAAFALISGSVLLVAFAAYEIHLQRVGKDPMFDVNLLKFRGFGIGNLTVLIVAAGEFGVLFFLSIYLQVVRGLSAINTGLTLLPLAIAAFIAAPLAGVAASKIGPKWVITGGMVLEAVGLFSIWQIVTITFPIWYLYPILALYGVGVGLDIGQLTNVVLASVPWQKAGVGSGVNNTVRQIGSAFGVAVIGAVLIAVAASVGKADLAVSTVIPEAIKSHLQSVLNNGLSAGLGSSASFGSGGGALSLAITHVFYDAFTQGTKWAAFTAGVFVTAGAICSLFIPNVKQQWQQQSGAQQWQQQSEGGSQQWPQQSGEAASSWGDAEGSPSRGGGKQGSSNSDKGGN
jgi:MFS family permease